MENKEQYILKYNVYNSIDFPKGTIVKIIDPKWEFEVVEGPWKGERGNIADGLNGWLLADTTENRLLLEEYKGEIQRINDAIKTINNMWELLPSVNVF